MGGDGNDRLEGGTGRDVLTGGIGPDRFHYVSASHSGLGNLSDWIMDFNSADGDKIDLTTVYSGTLSYIGEDQFGGTAGQLRVRDKDTFQHVQIDLNGDGASDMDIRLMNGGIAAASDFVL
jgi:Ca2+-binding RTX toxin-like protein